MSTYTKSRRQISIIDTVPFYYGWMVVAAAMMGMAMTIPGQTAGVSLFIDAFIEDLGLSRSSVSVAYTIATVTAALVLTQVGRWIDWVGPRLAVAVITVLFAGTLSLGPFVDSLETAWLYGTLFGLVQGMQDAIKGSGYGLLLRPRAHRRHQGLQQDALRRWNGARPARLRRRIRVS